ncbi:hypothetical protein KR093_010099 [Drosophila rubida]|uniref:Uncharacterized protein n=1 Tax=Drosophila rubida TaxID=30044 RepID=A0AAD4PMB7_9MUSC|nr:hypothetical protein KR093_010099 [Drosophila rubida]
MSSKFWVCLALISVGIAHTYVYTDFLKQVEAKETGGVAGYLSSMWPHVEKIGSRMKDDLRSMLQTGQVMVQVAQKAISDYRSKQKEKSTKQKPPKSSIFG